LVLKLTLLIQKFSNVQKIADTEKSSRTISNIILTNVFSTVSFVVNACLGNELVYKHKHTHS